MENQSRTPETAMTVKPFVPEDFLIIPARIFEDFRLGEIFRAPSRTITDEHPSAFQAVSCDNHPVHYDLEWAQKHEHHAPVLHGSQVLGFTACGVTLFPHVIGEAFIAFASLSCNSLKEVHSGDALYPALEIIKLETQDDKGIVETSATVHNQRGELLLEGRPKYFFRTPISKIK